MYDTLKKMVDAAVKASDGSKLSAAAKAVACTTSTLRELEFIVIDYADWIQYADMSVSKRKYDAKAMALFHTLFVPKNLSGKLYYVKEARKINNAGRLVVGKTVVRKRKSGIMNWSYGKPVHYEIGYVLETKIPKLRNVSLANTDQQTVTKCIQYIVRSKYKYRDTDESNVFDAIRGFLFLLRAYKLEREVITVDLPEVKCKVVEYRE